MSGSPVTLSRPGPGASLSGWGRGIMELAKIHLSLYIAVSALAGYGLARGSVGGHSIYLGGWVLVLSCGAAVLNNIQDRRWDRSVARTRNRVLARRTFPLIRAKAAAAILTGSGLAGLLLFYDSVFPVLLGIAALICYNGLYTPLKKISLWAMVPGVLCGMLPPAIGWTAVPGAMASTDTSGLVLLMSALGLWQFPHYLLVCLKAPATGTKDLLPGFTRIWSAGEVKCQVLIWTALFSLIMVLFLLRGWVDTPWIRISVFFTALFLPPAMAGLFLAQRTLRCLMLCFGLLNLSMLLFLSTAILDRI